MNKSTDVTATTRPVMIPFEGFHESYTDMMINDAQQYANSDEDGDELDWDARKYDFNDAAIREAVSLKYVKWLNDWIKEYSALDLNLTFVKLHSPREYNFTTDRIECELSDDMVALLAANVSIVSVHKAFADNFTSRSGFSSFYDPLSYKTPVSEWDYNQCAALLEAFIRERLTVAHDSGCVGFTSLGGGNLTDDNWLNILTLQLLDENHECFNNMVYDHATEINPT